MYRNLKLLFNFKNSNIRYILWGIFVLGFLVFLLFFIFGILSEAARENQNTLSYTVKVHNAYEEIDRIFEHAEVKIDVLADSISNSYDINKQQNKAYNMNYIKKIDGLIKSVLADSPNVDGCWFQLNADLPFAVHAYNWFVFKDNIFINLRNEDEETSSPDRKITPDADPYYFSAINNQKAVWSNIYTDADTKQQMMSISAPIYKNGILIGVVGIDISIYNLQYVLETMQHILPDSELYLLDKNYNLVISQINKDSLPSKFNYDFLIKLKESNAGAIIYNEYLTKKCAIMLLLSNRYNLVISTDNKHLFSIQNKLFNTVFILYIMFSLSITIILIIQYKMDKINSKNEEVSLEETEDTSTQE